MADPRVHGTTGRVVSEAFAGEVPHLAPLPPVPFDTSYAEERIVAWDAFIEVGGNRCAVPDELCGKRVQIRVGLDGSLRIFHSEELVAVHSLRPRAEGWVTVPGFHANLWAAALSVEKRPLSVYEEVG